MELEKSIIKILKEHTELKAKDIANIISAQAKSGIDKSDINKVLYAAKGHLFDCSIDYKWHLIKESEGGNNKERESGVLVARGTIIEIFHEKEGVIHGRKWSKRDLIIELTDSK